jgi:hypothetical protein
MPLPNDAPPPVPLPSVTPPSGPPSPPLAPPDDPFDDGADDGSDDDGSDDDADRAEAAIIANAACEHQDRLWLRAIIPLLQSRCHDSDPSPRVQLAYDRMHVAACEAIVRVMSYVGVHVGDVGGEGRA